MTKSWTIAKRSVVLTSVEPPSPFEQLVAIMARLRAPGGCPWDREQTHESIIPYLIEEANEAKAALAEQDWEAFKDEMGDVLCQVIFHALIAQEASRFTLDDICNAIREKLIRRHPHVFGNVKVNGVADVFKNWEEIKQKERQEKQKRKSEKD